MKNYYEFNEMIEEMKYHWRHDDCPKVVIDDYAYVKDERSKILSSYRFTKVCKSILNVSCNTKSVFRKYVIYKEGLDHVAYAI